jgi:ATP-dependent helicase Lhr and Lhr-like helicase
LNASIRASASRQVTFSTDLIYDVLQKYEPGHVLIEAAWADARARLTDVARIADVLERAAREVDHVQLDRVSPLAVPLLSMIGRESLPAGMADAELLVEAESLAAAAMRVD